MPFKVNEVGNSLLRPIFRGLNRFTSNRVGLLGKAAGIPPDPHLPKELVLNGVPLILNGQYLILGTAP